MKSIKHYLLRSADLVAWPLVYPAAMLLKMVRRVGVHRLPRCKDAMFHVGMFPIRDHYYEPQFDHRSSEASLPQDRNLPGIDWNIEGQLELLETFSFSHELEDIPSEKPKTIDFYFNNGTYESGDAEYWYQLIRSVKPRRIIEVGSGNSTLMALKALKKNREDNPEYICEHICIEPFEMPWLEGTGVSVVRKKIEDVELSFFARLQEDDILFIDSSHMIRPEGDVLFEYLELLPSLNDGVIVHVHDIFSPKNYPKSWLLDEVRFWNEQYLLEAFLSHNRQWKILGALNFLHHNHYDKLKSSAPYLVPQREPGSFYIQKSI